MMQFQYAWHYCLYVVRLQFLVNLTLDTTATAKRKIILFRQRYGLLSFSSVNLCDTPPPPTDITSLCKSGQNDLHLIVTRV